MPDNHSAAPKLPPGSPAVNYLSGHDDPALTETCTVCGASRKPGDKCLSCGQQSSPAGEAASERACANCKLGEAGHYREDGDERLRCLPGRDGRYRGLFYTPAVPEPVPTEGHKGRIAGGVADPKLLADYYAKVDSSAPEAAAAKCPCDTLTTHTCSEPTGAGMHTESYLTCDKCGAIYDNVDEAAIERHECAAPIAPAAEEFYIQDTRTYCGNSVMWWRVDGHGYTSNLADAWRVPATWKGRDTDKLWPCAEIDARTTRQFDMQLLREIKEYRKGAKNA